MPAGLEAQIKTELHQPLDPFYQRRMLWFLIATGPTPERIALCLEMLNRLDPDAQNSVVALWTRARCLTGVAAISYFERAAKVASVSQRCAILVDLADIHLERGDYDGVHRALDAAQGRWLLAAEYNRMAACLAERKDAVCEEITLRALSIAIQGPHNKAFFTGFATVSLFLNIHTRSPLWQTLFNLTSPLEDTVLRRILQTRLEQVPHHPRREALLGLLA